MLNNVSSQKSLGNPIILFIIIMQSLVKKQKPEKSNYKLEELKIIFPTIKINNKGCLENDQKIMLEKLIWNFSQIS